MQYLKKLEGKNAVVTGAGQGIGWQIAKDLLESGCNIIAQYNSSKSGAEKLLDIAEKWERKIWIKQADLLDETEIKDLAEETGQHFNQLDILINNAGGLVARKNIEEIDAMYWNKVMDINLTSTMILTRELLPLLSQSGASSIVNMASLAGRKGGNIGSLTYATSKGAVITWTRGLAAELASRGIRVNAVAPGLILGTAFHENHSTKESIENTIKAIPLQRAGTPEDVSSAVLFLASEYDGFITGITLDINGGVYMA
jgi:3-oxoacyl-[acyl-carrier protein] reductase